jgi:hypothetical protein
LFKLVKIEPKLGLIFGIKTWFFWGVVFETKIRIEIFEKNMYGKKWMGVSW